VRIVPWNTGTLPMREGMQDEGKTRWLALDLLRFVAVFLMVQGHTFTELLSTEVQHERWYRHHQFVHGYTAPMFLFASGLAFGYTTFRSWRRATEPGDALYKRLRRYGWLLVIGYLMHVPTLAPSGLVSAGDGPLHRLLQVDVLQHIGVSLCALQLLAVLVRRITGSGERVFAGIVGGLFLSVVLLAPIVWAWPAERELPLALAGFVNGGSGSYFPLVPWAGFTYAGVLVAYAARHVERPSQQLAPWLLGLTILSLGLPVVLNRLGVAPYAPHDFWRTDPYFFFFRLGNVTAILTALAYLEQLAGRMGVLSGHGRVARALRWVRVVGEESLVVYVAHLVVLHGWVIGPGLASSMGHSLSLVACSLVALSLFFAMVLVARGWSENKKSRLRWQALQVSAAGAMAYLVLIAR
jgi:uncharacterized membrane protein